MQSKRMSSIILYNPEFKNGEVNDQKCQCDCYGGWRGQFMRKYVQTMVIYTAQTGIVTNYTSGVGSSFNKYTMEE